MDARSRRQVYHRGTLCSQGKEAPGSETGHTRRRGRLAQEWALPIHVSADDEQDELRRREDAERQLFVDIERHRCPGNLHVEQEAETKRKAHQLAEV